MKDLEEKIIIHIQQSSFTPKVSRVDAEVILPSETLSCEQDAEYGRAIKEKLKSLETENIPADM
jgi:hypothetical protein